MVKLNKITTIMAVILFSLMMMGMTAAATMDGSNTISTDTTTPPDSIISTLESHGLNHVASEVAFSTQKSDYDEVRICPSCKSRSVIRVCGKEYPYYCYKCHYNFGNDAAHK